MRIIKTIILVITITILVLCAFGGGSIVFGIPLIWILKPSAEMCDLIVFLTALVPMPFAYWLAPKISKKYF